MKTITLCGTKDFLTFIDDYSEFTTIYLLMHISQVFKKFQIYEKPLSKECEMTNSGEIALKDLSY